jgi:lipopolysaccharide export system permease protein
LDRYLFGQLMQLFGFFSLVLVAVYWVNRAVLLFDQLIGDGQSAFVFLEITVLSLPNLIRLVLPVSAFAATVYAINRLAQDSELVAMLAAGASPWRIARPVAAFGLAVAVMLLILANQLVPASRAILADRMDEISRDVTARYLNAGRFMHPIPGVTLYIREITERGVLLDLFLADERKAGERTVYTARRALLVRGDPAPKLIMIEGMAQSVRAPARDLSITRFSDFTVDLDGLMAVRDREAREVDEMSTAELLFPTPALLAEGGEPRAAFLHDGHARLATPILGLAAPLLGAGALLLGGFSRFGLWWQIGFAVAGLVGLQILNTWASGLALAAEEGVWAIWAAPLAGVVAGLAMLARAAGPRPAAAARRAARRAARAASGGGAAG